MPNYDPRPVPIPRPDPLRDPAYAPLAWGRFKRILRWMALVSTLAGGGAVAALWHLNGPLPIHMAVATFVGVAGSIMMAAALMGLIFLSSGSGHDEAVKAFEPDE